MTTTMPPAGFFPPSLPPGGGLPPSPPPGGGFDGDRQRLVWMLETMRQILESTVYSEPSPFPSELRTWFLEAWPEAEKSLKDAIAVLRSPAQFETMYPRLRTVGLTGTSLQFKTASMEYHGRKYVGEFLTYPGRITWGERLARFAKPAFKCMNSIMGSLKEVLPGIEFAKEFKEHVEASVDALEQKE